jgi:hypothetical protein
MNSTLLNLKTLAYWNLRNAVKRAHWKTLTYWKHKHKTYWNVHGVGLLAHVMCWMCHSMNIGIHKILTVSLFRRTYPAWKKQETEILKPFHIQVCLFLTPNSAKQKTALAVWTVTVSAECIMSTFIMRLAVQVPYLARRDMRGKSNEGLPPSSDRG